jgi:class 3 adenylate cyclase
VETETAGTKGFLFCDLRGYTAYVEAHGDQAAAELLATYRELVRSVIAKHDGAEIRTEGDSFYIVFPAASGAVEAGLGIVAGAAERSTRERPIAVGIGIHAGETVSTDEGLVGGAVNIAARVCAKAQAGEVLVTDTVRALTRTFLPYTYTSLGTQQLKGIAGGIPLYRVEAVPSSGRARIARQLGARRGRLAVLTGLLVVALIAAGGAYALNRPADCLTLSASTKDVVVRIDPARNCVEAVYPVGQRPGAIVVTDDRVWVADEDSWTVSLLDPTTGARQAAGLPGSPQSIAATPQGDLVALVHDDRIREEFGDLATRNEQSLVFVTTAGARLAGKGGWRLPFLEPSQVETEFPGYAAVAVWSDRYLVTNRSYGRLTIIDTNVETDLPSAVTESTIRLKDATVSHTWSGASGYAGTDAIATSGGAAWVGDLTAPTLYRYTGADTADSVALDAHEGTKAIAATETTVWLLRGDGWLTAYHPIDGSQTSVAVGGSPTTLAVADGSVWVGDPTARSVRRIDPATGATLAVVATAGEPRGLAIGPNGDVWVTISAP